MIDDSLYESDFLYKAIGINPAPQSQELVIFRRDQTDYSNQFLKNSLGYRFAFGMYMKLFIDMPHMRTYGIDRNKTCRCNGLVRVSLHQQAKDLFFTLRQVNKLSLLDLGLRPEHLQYLDCYG